MTRTYKWCAFCEGLGENCRNLRLRMDRIDKEHMQLLTLENWRSILRVVYGYQIPEEAQIMYLYDLDGNSVGRIVYLQRVANYRRKYVGHNYFAHGRCQICGLILTIPFFADKGGKYNMRKSSVRQKGMKKQFHKYKKFHLEM